MAIPVLAALMVPEWYLEAFTGGISKDRRREMVHDYCLQVARAEAQRLGQPEPESIEYEAVMLTYEMYESALVSKE